MVDDLGRPVGPHGVSLTRTDKGQNLATLIGRDFPEALLQGPTAGVLDLPSNRQGLSLPRILGPGCLGLWQVPQEGATVEGRADAVLQVLGPVLVLLVVADGPPQAAAVELHHAGAPQAPGPGHQLQPGRSCGGTKQGAGLSVAQPAVRVRGLACCRLFSSNTRSKERLADHHGGW